MAWSYLVSEARLIITSRKNLLVAFFYFAVPFSFFWFAAGPVLRQVSDPVIPRLLSAALFISISFIVLQFYTFNKVTEEYDNGIMLGKCCLPLSPVVLTLCDLIVENLFGIILIAICYVCVGLFLNIALSTLLCACVLGVVSICMGHALALMSIVRTKMLLVYILLFILSLPLMFFVGGMSDTVHARSYMVALCLYSFFIAISCVIRSIYSAQDMLFA